MPESEFRRKNMHYATYLVQESDAA